MNKCCEECGAIIGLNSVRHVTCSAACSKKRAARHQREKRRATAERRQVTRSCTICGKNFNTIRYNRQTCSAYCSHANNMNWSRRKYASIPHEEKRIMLSELAQKRALDPGKYNEVRLRSAAKRSVQMTIALVTNAKKPHNA